MTEKSHVAMEHKVCEVCGTSYETGSILLDRSLRSRLDPNQITGLGLCKEHEKLKADGFVALVEVSNVGVQGTLRQENAVRTGRLCHLKAPAFTEIFGSEPPEGMVCFVEVGLIEKLQAITEGGGS